MSGMFPQFELGTHFRCPALDEEGYRCSQPPAHEGTHTWARCPDVDLAGHRCGLPPRHPGRHDPPWYDRPARAGDLHTARYEGTETQAGAIADAGSAIFARYGWVERSRRFNRGLIWRTPLAGFLAAALVTSAHGVLKATFEYCPTDVPRATQPARDPGMGNRRST